MTIPDVITAISVAIAAIAFVYGVNAWKREFVGKRRIELAETVLAMFYEAQDAIREIRNPLGSINEGKARTRSDNEFEEESIALDRANVVFERYQKRGKLFAELRAMKYRFMATFGADTSKPFDELVLILNEIFSSAHVLGTYYWQKRGLKKMSEEKCQEFFEQMQRHEAIFWFMGAENDKIVPRVEQAVKRIEEITKEASF